MPLMFLSSSVPCSIICGMAYSRPFICVLLLGCVFMYDVHVYEHVGASTPIPISPPVWGGQRIGISSLMDAEFRLSGSIRKRIFFFSGISFIL